MGTIKKGILGGFSGKVGTVVGASWKGIAYMRSLPQKVRNPRTVGQVSQRTKFSLALSVLKPITALLRIGWKLYAHRQSPINAAMSYTIANAINGVYPNYGIDPNKLLVSRGTLTPATNAAVNTSNGMLVALWDNNSGVGSAKATDKALIAILNLVKGEAITDTTSAERSDTRLNIAAPADWSGDMLHAYLGFISDDGKEVANSVYLGPASV